jgi:hypothetical protein
MALKSALTFVTRRISKAVEGAAAKQGLARSDYALVGSLDERTDRISLTLGTDHPIDDHRLYADTFAEIRRMFPDQPHITMQIGLVIRKVRNLDAVYLDNAFAEDELDLTELLERA